MKTIITFLIVFISGGANLLNASSSFGGWISCKSYAPKKYTVTIRVITDCNGLPPSTANLIVRNGTSTFYYSPSLVSSTDITGLNPDCGVASRCNGSYTYGFRMNTYKVNVDMDTFTNCETGLYYAYGVRSSAITTGAAGTDFCLGATINSCEASELTEVDFASLPPHLITRGDNFRHSFAVTDSLAYFDSISYSLVTPLNSTITFITYSSQWSASKPFTFLGFPNANLSSPAGFRIDGNSGSVFFRPTLLGEVSAWAVQMKGWKKIAGQMTSVYSMTQDMTSMIVNSLSNAPGNQAVNGLPSILGALSTQVCPGGNCLEIIVQDTNSFDTVYYQLKNAYPGSSVSDVSYAPNHKVIRVCYTPQVADSNVRQRNLVLEIRDAACPMPARRVISLIFNLQEQPDPRFFPLVQKSISCQKAKIKLIDTANYGKGFFIRYKNQRFNADSAELIFQDTGWNRYEIGLVANCEISRWDSVYNLYPSPIQVDITDSLAIHCLNSQAVFRAGVQGAQGSYHLEWNNGDSAQFTTYTIQNTQQQILVKVTDSAGCSDISSWIPRVSPAINSSMPDYRVCVENTDSLTVNANASGGTAPLYYSWSNGSLGPQVKYMPSFSHVPHWVEVTDSAGCMVRDSFHILRHQSYTPSLGADRNYCERGVLNLVVQAPPAVLNAGTFRWESDTIIYGTHFLRTFDTSRKVYLFYTDTLGCETSDSIAVVIHPPFSIDLGPDSVACANWIYTARPQVSGGQAPFVYRWNGQVGTDSFSFRPSVFHQVILRMTDANSCMAYDTVEISTKPSPTVSLSLPSQLCRDSAGIFNLSASSSPQGIWFGEGVVLIQGAYYFNPALAQSGSNDLRVLVYDSLLQCPAEAQSSIQVDEVPNADFMASSTQVSVNTPITFTMLNTIPFNYHEWSMGDGTLDRINLVRTHKYTSMGLYTVRLILDNNGCRDTVEKVDYIRVDSATGLNGIEAGLFNIYPNPSNGKFIVQGPFDGNSDLKLLDALGKEVDFRITPLGSEMLELNALGIAPGLYQLIIRSAQGISCVRLEVN